MVMKGRHKIDIFPITKSCLRVNILNFIEFLKTGKSEVRLGNSSSGDDQCYKLDESSPHIYSGHHHHQQRHHHQNNGHCDHHGNTDHDHDQNNGHCDHHGNTDHDHDRYKSNV